MRRSTAILAVLAALVLGAALLPAPAAWGAESDYDSARNSAGTDTWRVTANRAVCASSDCTTVANDTVGHVSADVFHSLVGQTREINLPLESWIDCQSTTPTRLDYVASGGTGAADALADFEQFTTAGRGVTLSWDNVSGSADVNSPVCQQLKVPSDYLSGGSIIARVTHSRGTAAATSVMSANFSVNGTAATAGTANLTADGLQTVTLTPTATLAANDALWLTVEFDTFGASTEGSSASTLTFRYTANQ